MKRHLEFCENCNEPYYREEPPEKKISGGCFVCRRAAIPGLAYQNKPVCARCAPYSLAGEMMLKTTEAEELALEEAGALAGEYLDSINKTDLAQLSDSEWKHFLSLILDGFSGAMRSQASVNAPF